MNESIDEEDINENSRKDNTKLIKINKKRKIEEIMSTMEEAWTAQSGEIILREVYNRRGKRRKFRKHV